MHYRRKYLGAYHMVARELSNSSVLKFGRAISMEKTL